MDSAYLVELGPILDDLGEQICLNQEIALGTLSVGNETFVPVAPARLDVTLTNTGAGVVAQGTIQVDVKATCARCLCEFTLHGSGDVEGFYVTPAHATQLPDEQDFELIEDRSIDLMPALLAALTVDLPFAPLHDPECLGICPSCGIDRNAGTCECAQDTPDSPFDALRGLFPDESAR